MAARRVKAISEQQLPKPAPANPISSINSSKASRLPSTAGQPATAPMLHEMVPTESHTTASAIPSLSLSGPARIIAKQPPLSNTNVNNNHSNGRSEPAIGVIEKRNTRSRSNEHPQESRELQNRPPQRVLQPVVQKTPPKTEISPEQNHATETSTPVQAHKVQDPDYDELFEFSAPRYADLFDQSFDEDTKDQAWFQLHHQKHERRRQPADSRPASKPILSPNMWGSPNCGPEVPLLPLDQYIRVVSTNEDQGQERAQGAPRDSQNVGSLTPCGTPDQPRAMDIENQRTPANRTPGLMSRAKSSLGASGARRVAMASPSDTFQVDEESYKYVVNTATPRRKKSVNPKLSASKTHLLASVSTTRGGKPSIKFRGYYSNNLEKGGSSSGSLEDGKKSIMTEALNDAGHPGLVSRNEEKSIQKALEFETDELADESQIPVYASPRDEKENIPVGCDEPRDSKTIRRSMKLDRRALRIVQPKEKNIVPDHVTKERDEQDVVASKRLKPDINQTLHKTTTKARPLREVMQSVSQLPANQGMEVSDLSLQPAPMPAPAPAVAAQPAIPSRAALNQEKHEEAQLRQMLMEHNKRVRSARSGKRGPQEQENIDEESNSKLKSRKTTVARNTSTEETESRPETKAIPAVSEGRHVLSKHTSSRAPTSMGANNLPSIKPKDAIFMQSDGHNTRLEANGELTMDANHCVPMDIVAKKSETMRPASRSRSLGKQARTVAQPSSQPTAPQQRVIVKRFVSKIHFTAPTHGSHESVTVRDQELGEDERLKTAKAALPRGVGSSAQTFQADRAQIELAELLAKHNSQVRAKRTVNSSNSTTSGLNRLNQ